MPLLETRKLTAFYGDFQALYGIDTTLEKGETIAIIGANGAGKSTFLTTIAGLISASADSVLLDGAPIGARAAADIVKLGIATGARRTAAVSLADGRGKPADRRLRPQDEGRLDARSRLFAVSGAQGAAHLPRHRRCRAGSSRWRRSAARLMSNPRILSVRRDQPGARADHHRRHLCGASAKSRLRHQHRAGRAGHRAGDEGGRSRLLLPGGSAFARWPPSGPDTRDQIHRAYFGR